MKKILLAVVISAICFPGAAFSKFDAGDVDIHGFISQGYIQSDKYGFYNTDTEEGSYEFNELGLNFSSMVSDDLRIGMQFMSKDLGEVGNNEVEVDWAYADYNVNNWLGLRVGKIKKANALFNEYRDIDASRTCIFLPTNVYPEEFREPYLAHKGAGIYGTLPGNIEYQASYGVFDIDKDGGVATRLSREMGAAVTGVDVNPSYNLFLKWHTPLDGLSIGTARADFDVSLDGEIDTSALTPAGVGGILMDSHIPFTFTMDGYYQLAFLQYYYKNFMFATEYMAGTENTTVYPIEPKSKDAPRGYYFMTTYRFSPLFELGTYYSYIDGDKDDANAPELKDFAISTRFDITMNWIFKMEAHFMDGLRKVDTTGHADPSNHWELYAAKLTYTF
ncbi:MAG: hypothetical protein SWH68_10040 [Thermodesulfobacteriota bacterium]|nr:hypothetical protein [Thermodesulfobacteriota bacterium]